MDDRKKKANVESAIAVKDMKCRECLQLVLEADEQQRGYYCFPCRCPENEAHHGTVTLHDRCLKTWCTENIDGLSGKISCPSCRYMLEDVYSEDVELAPAIVWRLMSQAYAVTFSNVPSFMVRWMLSAFMVHYVLYALFGWNTWRSLLPAPTLTFAWGVLHCVLYLLRNGGLLWCCYKIVGGLIGSIRKEEKSVAQRETWDRIASWRLPSCYALCSMSDAVICTLMREQHPDGASSLSETMAHLVLYVLFQMIVLYGVTVIGFSMGSVLYSLYYFAWQKGVLHQRRMTLRVYHEEKSRWTDATVVSTQQEEERQQNKNSLFIRGD